MSPNVGAEHRLDLLQLGQNRVTIFQRHRSCPARLANALAASNLAEQACEMGQIVSRAAMDAIKLKP
jgi:hypothetical protein